MRLELRGMTKQFGSFTANDQISLTVEPGQIHSLLGENGAGKSTLMNVLFGLLRPDEGEILIDGGAVTIANSGEAVRRGIGMVHQHFMLVPVFSVTENVVLGFEPSSLLTGWTTRRQLTTFDDSRSNSISKSIRTPSSRTSRWESNSGSRSSRHSVTTPIYSILDEPTAVLTPQEIDALMAIMRSLAAAGKSILFITHKLKEVKAIADVITIIRQGKVVGTAEPTATEAELASMMVGRDVKLTVEKSAYDPGDAVFEIRDLVVRDDRGLVAVNGVSLDVCAGEILALAGVQGNGQTELVEAIAGMRPVVSGTITLQGRDITNTTPRKVLDAGIGHIPEDRQRDGLVLSMSVSDNLVLNTPRRAPFASRGTRNLAAVKDNAERLVNEFDIRATSIEEPVSSLSGGNQQKVIVARELSRDLEFLVASQPTRGLDVGSIEYVHRQIVEHRNQGNGALIVSSELDEVIALGRPNRRDVRRQDQRHRRPFDEPRGHRSAHGRPLPGGHQCLTSLPRRRNPCGLVTRRRVPSSSPSTLSSSDWSVGALIITTTTPAVLDAWRAIFSGWNGIPGTRSKVTFDNVGAAYRSMFTGSVVDPQGFWHSLVTGKGWSNTLTPISETLTYATPLVIVSIGVGIAIPNGTVQHRRERPSGHRRHRGCGRSAP